MPRRIPPHAGRPAPAPSGRRTAAAALAVLTVLAGCAGPAGPGPGAGAGAALDPAAPARAMRLHLDGRPPGAARLDLGPDPDVPVRVALVSRAAGALGFGAVCDGPARLVARPDPPQPAAPRSETPFAAAGVALTARLAAGARDALALDIAPGTQACRLTVQPWRAPAYALDLARASGGADADAAARRAAIDRGAPRCTGLRAPAGDALAAAFAAERPLRQTCPMPPGPVRLLPDGIEALDARVEALTGRRLGPARLASGDPEQPIDFAAAPRLDLIVVSYLNLNADYSGRLMARMLEFHAARGTEVRILVADPMWGGPERALFEGLAARHPSVRILPFRYPPQPGDGIEGHIGRLHRVQHVKLFAVLGPDPARARAMIGGRNLADGYAFAAPFDLAAHPGLRRYRPGRALIAGGFHSYRDLEIAFHGPAQVAALVAHWSELWQMDPATARPAAPRAAPVPAPTIGRDGPLMRHFLSVPWADGGAQARLFADLIGAAQRRIDIASPYLNPPPEVAAALAAALARGVAVRIVTTERVTEAADPFITGLNRLFADRWTGRLTYLDHDPRPRLLHTKAMVIDGRLTVLGSTNLNLRSFVHDLENGVMVLDPGLAAQVTALIDGYAAAARPIPPGRPVAPWVRLMLRWPLLRRAF